MAGYDEKDERDNGIDPLWKLYDRLTIEQAAALIAGYDPSSIDGLWNDTNSSMVHPRPCIARDMLVNAIKGGTLKADVVAKGEYVHVRYVGNESEGFWEPIEEISTRGTLIDVDELKRWLTSRGFQTGFFFQDADQDDQPGYLDPDHPRYAPKLAAAVSAWLAVGEPEKGTPKQAIEKWIREHAAQFGLTDDDGNPVNAAVEEIAKVANWNTKGGAGRTPGGG